MRRRGRRCERGLRGARGEVDLRLVAVGVAAEPRERDLVGRQHAGVDVRHVAVGLHLARLRALGVRLLPQRRELDRVVERADRVALDGKDEVDDAADGRLQATLAAVQQEADHTRHFLDELTRYNVAIADYALAVLPEQSSAGQLVSALVVTRGGRGN